VVNLKKGFIFNVIMKYVSRLEAKKPKLHSEFYFFCIVLSYSYPSLYISFGDICLLKNYFKKKTITGFSLCLLVVFRALL